MTGKATLTEYKAGFGGDNFTYRVDPPFRGETEIMVCVGWGLLSVSTITVLNATDTTQILYEDESPYVYTPPHKVLAQLGYETAPIWAQNGQLREWVDEGV